ncbi:MAG: zinc-binding dehydrogenase [Verrucomicrobia bacterium]|nr:zinc-binding dehydrogenase [Verrucomicrobiota bacterium]
MKTLAAVLVETGRPLELAELEVPTLQAGQVLVDIAFSGVCHTQLLEARGYRGNDPFLPHCMGHEGSGRVIEVGPEVSKVKSGDEVVLSWIQGTGANVQSTIYKWNGRAVNAGAVTTFSRQSIISENRLTRLPAHVPTEAAALLGCAIPTGFGSVLNTAQARPGQSIAVFGVGGVGLCAVVAAAMVGCKPIIAVDVLAHKLELAKLAGATDIVMASSGDPLQAIRRLIPDGIDLAVEATGRPEVMVQALAAVRRRGGTSIVIGNARKGERLSLDPGEFNQGKRILGTWGGDSSPDIDFPRYAKLLVSSKLNLPALLGRIYSLESINEALEGLESGQVARPLIDMRLGAPC